MPFGFAAIAIWLAAVIMWGSGWKEETAGDIPGWTVVSWLAGWPLAVWKMNVTGEKVAIGGAVFWTLLAAAALLWRMADDDRRTALSAGFFCCTLGVMIAYLLSPLLSATLGTTVVTASALIGWTASLWGKQAAVQFVAVTLATLMPEGWKWVAPTESERVWIGSGQWMATWWIGMTAARLGTYLRSVVVPGLWSLARRE